MREFCKTLREKVDEGRTDEEITDTVNNMMEQVLHSVCLSVCPSVSWTDDITSTISDMTEQVQYITVYTVSRYSEYILQVS